MNMKLSIIPVFLASIFALVLASGPRGANASQPEVAPVTSPSAPSAESKEYTGIGTYYYKCSCDQRPPVGGAFAKGVCYPPGSSIFVSPQDPHDTWPDFAVTSDSEAYPNDYTANGYQFSLSPLNEVTFEFNCPSQGVDAVSFDKNGSVSCDEVAHTSTSKTVQCRNKSESDHHHLNINHFKYDDG